VFFFYLGSYFFFTFFLYYNLILCCYVFFFFLLYYNLNVVFLYGLPQKSVFLCILFVFCAFFLILDNQLIFDITKFTKITMEFVICYFLLFILNHVFMLNLKQTTGNNLFSFFYVETCFLFL